MNADQKIQERRLKRWRKEVLPLATRFPSTTRGKHPSQLPSYSWQREVNDHKELQTVLMR